MPTSARRRKRSRNVSADRCRKFFAKLGIRRDLRRQLRWARPRERPSHDGAVLEALAEKYGSRLRIVTHGVNRGYGGALRSGFAAATKDLVFYTDGDSQYDVGELPKLLHLLKADVGLVNGYKLERNDPWHRIFIGNLYNRFARILFRIRIRDIDCDFRLMRRSLLESIQLTSTSGTICVELVRKLELSGWGVVEVGVHHYARRYGRSQFFRVRSLITTFSQLVRLWVKLVVIGVPTSVETTHGKH